MLEKWAYLIATKFHVVKDHKPLNWLLTTKYRRGRLARWTYRLKKIDFTTGHFSGVQKEIAHALLGPIYDVKVPDAAIQENINDANFKFQQED